MSKNTNPVSKANLRRSPVARACLTAVMAMAGVSAVQAGVGFGDTFGPGGVNDPKRIQTFYAHTPSGQRDAIPPEAATIIPGYNGSTGKALRKFVDPLPGVGASANTLADGTTSKYIPAAAPAKWVTPEGKLTNDDYYELAVVQYKEKFHSDLANETTLRGYVQLTKDSTKFPLKYPDGGAILIQDTDSLGKLLFNADGSKKMVQAYSTEKPHYLGPAIIAVKGTATRIKFHNLLPAGRYDAAKGRNGDLFIPVDETLPGAGVGPDGVTRYTQNRAELHLHGGDTPWISDGTPHQWIAPAAEADLLAVEMAKAGSTSKPADFLRGASAANVPDMNDPGDGAVTYYYPNLQSGRLMWYHDHTFGLTRLNAYVGQAAPYVLVDPKQDAMLAGGSFNGVDYPGIRNFPKAGDTLYLVIQDKTFVPDDIKLQDGRWNQDVNGNYLDGSGAAAPLWGQPGDLWYPHVYEVNQDPNNGADGTNPVGRWDWGPYFWPVFPSLYNLPTGKVGDVTITPEAWMDTPVVNGVAYPTMTVDPKPYRMRILNGANDRFWNLSMFVADSAVSTIEVTDGGSGYDAASTVVTLVNKPNAGGSGATAEAVVVGGKVTAIRVTNAGSGYTKTPNIFITDANGNTTASASAALAVNTEVKMVPAAPPAISANGLAACATTPDGVDIAPPYAPPCWPSTWPTDGRDGGVPDPTTAGPKFYQIGTEGGLLPGVAEIAAAPMQYEYNRRSITVLNTWSHGLFLGNAERADAVVDFSNFAGQTLIVYNDSPAPVPAFDPRNDHWTGKPDESMNGSVETPRAGFGPNTRTIMQIKVADKPATTPLDVAGLKAKLPEIYGATQEAPVVAQEAYAAAFGKTTAEWSNAPKADGTKAYATIFTGSLQEPTFKFTPGVGAGSFKVGVTNGGSGYVNPPAVTITPDPADVNITVPATAVSSLRIASVTLLDKGAGYQYSPTVTFTSTGTGTGANAYAWLSVNTVTGLQGGAGYPANATIRLNFSAPQRSNYVSKDVAFDRAANTAWGEAQTDANGAIIANSFVLKNAGNGYTSAPLLSMVTANGDVPTTYPTVPTVDGKIEEIQLLSTDPNHPELAGGVGYTDLLNTVTVRITAPTGANPRAARTSITGAVTDVTLVNAGQGYTKAPTISLAAPAAGTTATATATYGGSSFLVKNKAIQELFDPTYGRMNATLGVEIPFTSALTQTTIPLGYVDPVSEEFNDGETQIWKITHNGVDSHPVHFHLLNVQLINRVGWDGTVKPPKDNEFGWKETIKMNPLEDILVAVRAKKPVLPGFGLPNSSRLMDPSQPKGVPTGFTQIDVKTGLPATIVNDTADYGWEYVWHCHILGHEENDFMRPVKFNANEAAPTAPTNVVSSINGTTADLSWNDTSTTEYKFRIERVALDTAGVAIPKDLSAFFTPAFALANSQSFTDTIPTPPAGTNAIQYRVVAVGAGGEAGSVAVPGTVVQAPAGLTSSMDAAGAITLSWTTGGATVASYQILASLNGAAPVVIGTQAKQAGAKNTFAYTPASVTAGDSYQFQVVALDAQNHQSSATSLNAPVVYSAPAAATSLVTSLASSGVISLSWTAPSGVVTNYLVQPLLNGVATGTAQTVTTTSTTFTPSSVAAGQVYSFQVTAQRLIGSSTLKSAVATSGNVTYAAPAAVASATTSLNATSGTVTVSWPVSGNATQYSVQPVLNGTDTGPALPTAALSTTFTPTSVNAGDVYTFKVTAQEIINGTPLSSAAVTAAGSATYVAPTAPASLTATLPAGTTGTTFNLSWLAGANATGYSIQPLLTTTVNGQVNTSPIGTATDVGAVTSTTVNVPATAGDWSFKITAKRGFTGLATVLPSATTVTSAATTFALPGAPTLNGTLLALTSTGSTSTATVKWAAPTGATVPGVTGYYVVITDANGMNTTSSLFSNTTYTNNTLARFTSTSTTTAAVSNNTIAVSTTNLPTGTAVVYGRGTGNSITSGGNNLSTNTTYYVINVDATHIKLATSKANATAGTAINISGGGAGNTISALNSFNVTVKAANAVGTGTAALSSVSAVTAP